MTTHVADTPYVESKVWLGRKVSGEKPVVPEKFAEGYNVAGLLWTPEKLVWTLNGRVMREMKNEDFHRPLYLNIDCEIMKPWGGAAVARRPPRKIQNRVRPRLAEKCRFKKIGSHFREKSGDSEFHNRARMAK